MDLQDVQPEFYSNEEQPPRKVFLRGISPLKVFPPEGDAWRLVACNPCGRQAGGVSRYRRVIASFPLVYRGGRDVHCIVGVLRKSSHTLCRS